MIINAVWTATQLISVLVVVNNGADCLKRCRDGRRSSISSVRWDIDVYMKQVSCPAITCTRHHRILSANLRESKVIVNISTTLGINVDKQSTQCYCCVFVPWPFMKPSSHNKMIKKNWLGKDHDHHDHLIVGRISMDLVWSLVVGISF